MMFFSQALEQVQQQGISEWLHGLGDIGVVLMLMYFRWSAKRDTRKRHEENKSANEATQQKQEKILQELQAERDYLPQHWHTEFGSPPARALTAGGILRQPSKPK